MGDRCYSTLICAERDKEVFEKMGYRLEESSTVCGWKRNPRRRRNGGRAGQLRTHDELTA